MGEGKEIEVDAFGQLKLSIMMLLVNLNYQNVISNQQLLKVVSNLKTNSRGCSYQVTNHLDTEVQEKLNPDVQ